MLKRIKQKYEPLTTLAHFVDQLILTNEVRGLKFKLKTMDLKHKIIMEMVITGFCSQYEGMLEELGIESSSDWRSSDLDTWFRGTKI